MLRPFAYNCLILVLCVHREYPYAPPWLLAGCGILEAEEIENPPF